MGAWGTAIKSNDTSSDIYSEFYDLYNEGAEPKAIADKLINENRESIDSPEDSNNFWFALSLALWETKSLNEEIYLKVKEAIVNGQDLLIWKELDASENDLKKRKAALDKFLEQISTARPKAKARKKLKVIEPIFEKGTCLSFKLENGNYGGAIVLEADKQTGYGYNLIVTTRLNEPNKPSIQQFEKAEVLVANFADWDNQPNISWYLSDRFQKETSNLFEVAGQIRVETGYTPNDGKISASFSGSWQHVIEPVELQLSYEREKNITKSFPVKQLTRKKKWWQF